MNHRKRDTSSRLPGTTLIAILSAAAISAAGGVLHAYYKNLQVGLARDIDASERRTEQCRLEIRTTEMRMDQLLNRFVIRKQLQENGSALRPIVLNQIQEVSPAPAARRAVAASP